MINVKTVYVMERKENHLEIFHSCLTMELLKKLRLSLRDAIG